MASKTTMGTFLTLPDDLPDDTPYADILRCYPEIGLRWSYRALVRQFGERGANEVRKYAVTVYTDYRSWQGYQESQKPITPMFQSPLISNFDAA